MIADGIDVVAVIHPRDGDLGDGPAGGELGQELATAGPGSLNVDGGADGPGVFGMDGTLGVREYGRGST